MAKPVTLTLANLRHALVRAGRDLPPPLAEAVLALGLDVVPALLDILDDPLLDEVGPPGTWAPLHAAALLGRLHAVEALPTLLEVLCYAEPDDELAVVAAEAVTAMGADALGPVLEAWDDLAPDETEQRASLAILMSGLGVKDDQIFSALVAYLDLDVEPAAIALGQYGDPAALPHLQQALETHLASLAEQAPFGREVIELDAAIVALGGEPLPVLASQPRVTQRPRLPVPPRPGRNDPCWCLSGQKYKKCHLRADETT
jgi:hypothetical protein